MHPSVRLVSLQGLIHVSGLYEESLLRSRERKKEKSYVITEAKTCLECTTDVLLMKAMFRSISPSIINKAFRKPFYLHIFGSLFRLLSRFVQGLNSSSCFGWREFKLTDAAVATPYPNTCTGNVQLFSPQSFI